MLKFLPQHNNFTGTSGAEEEQLSPITRADRGWLMERKEL